MPQQPVSRRRGGKRHKPAWRNSYHHGNLRAQLLAVTGFAQLALIGELRTADGRRADENTILHCLLPATLAHVTTGL